MLVAAPAPTTTGTFVGRNEYPLLIAVTGHRDLRDEDHDQLKQTFRSLLSALCKRWRALNGPAQAPIVVMSGLAEGADQLAAEVVLELAHTHSGLQLAAVLPMPVDEYRATLETEASRAKFDELHEKAALRRVLPTPPGQDSDHSPTTYEAAYEQLGLFLAEQSFLLFAFWDGVDTHKPGGTAHVVAMKRQGGSAWSGRPSALFERPCGATVQIVTPRRSNRAIAHPFQVRLLLEEDQVVIRQPQGLLRQPRVAGTMDALAGCNRGAATLPENSSGALRMAREGLLPTSEPVDAFTESLCQRYAVADVLATQCQKRGVRLIRAYAVLVLLTAMLLGVIYYFPPLKPRPGSAAPTASSPAASSLHTATLPPDRNSPTQSRYAQWRNLLRKDPAAVMAYMLVVLAIFLLYSLTSQRNVTRRFANFRGLAEGLRVQVFWRLAGLSHRVADHYQSHQVEELEWLRVALKTVYLDDTGVPSPNIHVVRSLWVHGQHAWLKRKIATLRAADRRLAVAFWVLLGPAAPWALLKVLNEAFPQWCGVPSIDGSWSGLSLGLSFGMLALSWASAAFMVVATYRKLRGFGQIAARYERLLPLYRAARRKTDPLEAEDADDQVQATVLELGKHALAENADWLLLQKDVRFEPPKG